MKRIAVVVLVAAAAVSAAASQPAKPRLVEPFGVASDGKGGLLIADRAGNRVFRRLPSGRLVVVAGNGRKGFGGEGIATRVALGEPEEVAIDSAGNVYVAGGNRVLKVTPKGLLTRIAGTGVRGTSGDGGPARRAKIDGLGSVALDPADNVFVTEYENRIRRIDARTRIITTYAGTGAIGDSGDGGLATRARIYHPHGVAVGPDGAVYVADTSNNRIRRIDPASRVITTVAGNGQQGFSGDGGPATEAMLSLPVHLDVAPDGTLYVSDHGNRRIRRVDPDGRISTVTTAFGASIFVALDGAGGLWVSELEPRRLRRLDLATGKISAPVR